MAPPKKAFIQCGHCGRGQVETVDQDGFLVKITGQMKLFFRIECNCGIMTKLCPTRDELQVVWNSRPTKTFVPTKVEVKSHAPVRGLKASMVDDD